MATGSGYDAFISYSHQHDRKLGPALKARLERFAKPWYRRRALRIFLDKASLSANPGLWASIEDALGSSQWFILLASDDAARSAWVDREVRWWREHRSGDRLLIVATSPGLKWETSERDWSASAPVPPALRGTFSDEPLWIDLSDLPPGVRASRIPTDSVASLAAVLRDVPKDLLVGEHVRVSRQAVRFAGAGVVVLAISIPLAVVGVLAALGSSKVVAFPTLLLYSAIFLAFVTVSSLVPLIWSRVRRRLLEVNVGGVKIAFSEKRVAQEPPRHAEDPGEFVAASGLVAEDLRVAEYKNKRDEAERELGLYLPANPRAAKRLINHERLYVTIAEDRGIFGGNPELTYRHLAKWVLIIEHWPRLATALTGDPSKMEALESCTNTETLQQRLSLVEPNSRATDELLIVLSKAVPLSPILGRLIRFESPETGHGQMTPSHSEE